MLKKILITSLFVFCSSLSSFAKSQVDVITIDNYIINPIVNEYVSKAIKDAEENNSECLVIQLDTPGGLLESTRQIVKNIMNSKVPIVVYISPSGSRAGSAGVFITLASNIAAMAPSTNIGAAHPVNIGQKEITWPEAVKELAKSIREKGQKDKSKKEEKDQAEKDSEEPMSDKIMNDTIAWVTAIAKKRGRNAEWAKDAVEKSVSITDEEALKENVIDLIAQGLDDLLEKIDGREIDFNGKKITLNTKDAGINFIDLTNRQKILNILINPTIAYVLMMLGFYGLLFEFTHPGIGFPGIAGFICIILAFYAFQAISVNYAGMILIILGLILFIAEALTPATFGLLTLGGAVSMFFGSLMLIGEPAYFYKLSLNIVVPFIVTTGGVTLFLVSRVVKAHKGKITSGKEGLIGSEAEAITNLNPEGKVFCHGEIWNAECSEGVKKKDKLIVKEVKGLKLIVETKKRG